MIRTPGLTHPGMALTVHAKGAIDMNSPSLTIVNAPNMVLKQQHNRKVLKGFTILVEQSSMRNINFFILTLATVDIPPAHAAQPSYSARDAPVR